MSIWIADTYATVWEPVDRGNFVTSDISTSKKTKEGKYENSSWKAIFVGNALEDAKYLSNKDRIRITGGNVYMDAYESKGETKRWPKVVIMSFDLLSDQQTDNKDVIDDDDPI